MLKEFLMKKMLERQLSQVPPEQRDKLIKVVSEHPELFQKIAEETKQKMDSGKDQMTAVMEVVKKYQTELSAIMEK